MISFIHCADVHFGNENYGRIDPETGIHTRLLDFYKAMDFCVTYAIDHQVDFFLFCGDAYKTAHPTQTQQRLLIQCLLRLYHANIPVVMVLGNHDHPLSYGKAHALNLFGQLPLNGFYLIDKPQIARIPTKHGPISIVGIPWPTRNYVSLAQSHLEEDTTEIADYIAQAVARIIAQYASELPINEPAILASHLTVASGIFSGSEKRAIYGNDPVLMTSQLALSPFNYVALGHLHRFQDLNKNGIPIVYAGSIERIDFGERKEDKGFVHVTINDNLKASYQFIKTPTRPFIQIEVDIKPHESVTDQIIHAIKKHDITGAILKILYYLPASNTQSLDMKKIEFACQDAMYVVGIFPVKDTIERTHQIRQIGPQQDLMSLVQFYCSQKPEYTERTQELMKKIQLLEQKLHEQENQ